MKTNYNIKKQLLLLILFIVSSFSFAQTGWSIDQNFNKRVAKTNDYFFRVSKRTDGKFLFCTDTDKTKLKLLNLDGSISTTFEVPTTGNIIALTQATGNKTYVGGDFTNMMNVFAPKIARINADGTRDINFLPDTSTQNVYALQEQADGKLLVGRDGSIQRLNDDGTLDTTFTTATTNGIVYSFSILPNGKILAGGLFTTINGATKNRVVLLNANGTVDTSFVVGTGFNSDVHIVRVASDGSFFVGGKFTTYKGTTINRIAKLSNTGTLDTTFHTSNTGFNNDVWTIEFLNDNKPLLGGLFTTYKGIVNNSVIKLNLDGTIDATFDTGTAQSNGFVYKIIVNSANDVFLSGTFMKYKDTYTNQAFLVNNDGSVNTSLNLDNRFCAPGESTFFGTSSWGSYTPKSKHAITLQSDGKIIIGNVYFENKFYILIRLNQDGTKDETFNFNPILPNNAVVAEISKIIVRPNGKIICSTAEAGKMNYCLTSYKLERILDLKAIFQLNSDGTIDNSFDSGFNVIGSSPSVDSRYGSGYTSMALQQDGKIIFYCTSPFNYKGFDAQPGLIRILENGKLDLSFQNSIAPIGHPVEIIQLPNGNIITYNTNDSRNGNIIKFKSDGTLATDFKSIILESRGRSLNEPPTLHKIDIDGNSLIIAGDFSHINGNSQPGMAKIDFNGNYLSDFKSPLLPQQIPTYENSMITDFIKNNNRYYYTTVSNTVISKPIGGSLNIIMSGDINISRTNADGTLDKTFETVTIDRSNFISITNGYSNCNPLITPTPFNVSLGFNEKNKLVVFGQYNSIKGGDFTGGLSRIIIDENLSTSSNEFPASTIKVHPNPTNDLLNISSQNETINQINVYNLLGALLKSKKGKSDKEEINIQDFPNATYLVEIKTDKGNKTVKIIKQ